MNIFENGKRYKFDLNIALEDKHIKTNYESEHSHSKYWIDYCNGKEVVVTGALDGSILSPYQDYVIAPWWCEEIK